MQNQSCDQVPVVQHAISSGKWTVSTLEHALGCEICRDLWIADYMRQKAQVETSAPASSNADILWWKARLQQNQNRVRQTGVVFATAHALAFIVGLLALFNVISHFVFQTGDKLAISGAMVIESPEAMVVILCAVVLSTEVAQIGRYFRRFLRQ